MTVLLTRRAAESSTDSVCSQFSVIVWGSGKATGIEYVTRQECAICSASIGRTSNGCEHIILIRLCQADRTRQAQCPSVKPIGRFTLTCLRVAVYWASVHRLPQRTSLNPFGLEFFH